jgi:hypothetical protein
MVNAPWATLQPGMLGAGGGQLPSWLDTAGTAAPGMELAPNLGQTGTVAQNMGFFGNGQGIGFNAPTASMALGGLQTLAGLWGGIQQMKLAKKSFKFTKDMAETNLANQMKTYNTALADRARSRGAMESQSQAQVDQYVADNSLSRNRGG